MNANSRRMNAVAGRLEMQTQTMQLRNTVLRQQQELARLEQRWAEEREVHLIYTKEGYREPGFINEFFRAFSLFGFAAAIIFIGLVVPDSYRDLVIGAG